jgi:hypothetical protein
VHLIDLTINSDIFRDRISVISDDGLLDIQQSFVDGKTVVQLLVNTDILNDSISLELEPGAYIGYLLFCCFLQNTESADMQPVPDI